MAKGELLLEVRSEEIPARMLLTGIEQLARRLFEDLVGRGLAPDRLETGFTPRRMVVVMRGLAESEPDREEEALGPPVAVAFDTDGKPTPAALGFAKRCGLAVGELGRSRTEKGEYLSARRVIVGAPTRDVLAELVPRALAELPWPKTMRWGTATGPWVRPVHGLVALFAGEPVELDVFGVAAGDTTCGHPIHSPRPFKVRGWADYRRKLSRRRIEVRFGPRREKLLAALEAEAAEAGGELVQDPALLGRLTATCGTPGVVRGGFDPAFLELPREVLEASLRDHQSAFTVEKKGELLPVFLTLMDRSDDPEGRIRSGNEWVVAARLADARFFFSEDRKVPLAERKGDLERLAFHQELGSYADKASRIEKLAGVLCDELGWDDVRDDATEAAGLLKLDLTTEMVKEFTSLQGIVGGVYARLEGRPAAVWRAVYDHYLPASHDDPIPRDRAGRVVALADRIDTLIGIFGLGLVPTSSKDPFGLRRAAQGVVRITLEGALEVDLDLIAAKAFQLYGERLTVRGDEVLASWRAFLFDRVRTVLGRRGYAYDEIEAALAVGGGRLTELQARVEALHAARREPGFLEVVLAAKRIAKILVDKPERELDPKLLTESAEIDLHRAFVELKEKVDTAEAAGEYGTCLRQIAGFAAVLDRFFVEVLVMDENLEIRNNRLGLLQSIQRVLSRTAGLTEMVVDRAEHRERHGQGAAGAETDDSRGD
ncbi:MAG: glycine--tRNA ligase subunit beta [Thermoanaerobaculia bacterium]|nr:glycine--tRNA ligase subunit beta [Thermoanaerobaculia bacterium]